MSAYIQNSFYYIIFIQLVNIIFNWTFALRTLNTPGANSGAVHRFAPENGI